MLKILIAAALTVGVPIALLMACYFVAKIPFVERCFDVDKNDPFIDRVSAGFTAIAVFILAPVSGLILLLSLFVAFYNLL